MSDASSGAEAIWVTGASSGIGAALVASAPAGARVIGVSRRSSDAPEHISADLSDPDQWSLVEDSFAAVLESRPARATLLHFAGLGAPHGPAAEADPDEYRRSVLLNGASGQVLGQSFLRQCVSLGIPCRIVLCSSPAAIGPLYGMSHYNAAKTAYDRWAACLRLEVDPAEAIVFTVVPWSVDTPMLRGVMELPPEVDPIGAQLKEMDAKGELATPEGTAAEIWELLERGGVDRPAFIGAVPEDISDGRP